MIEKINNIDEVLKKRIDDLVEEYKKRNLDEYTFYPPAEILKKLNEVETNRHVIKAIESIKINLDSIFE